MTYLGKLLRKFAISFFVVTFSLIFINAFLYGFYVYFLTPAYSQNAIKTTLETVSSALNQKDSKEFTLTQEGQKLLETENIWAMLLDNQDGSVLWQSRLPKDFPRKYSSTDIAKFSRGYLFDYPVFVWEHSGGLLVLGYPKSSYTKQLSNFQPLETIRNAPFFLLSLFLIDVILLFFLYYQTELRTLKLLNPFIEGISQLAKGHSVNLQAGEPLSELAQEINQVSKQLQKKDTARANWISGISHDIRTPLSIILGYSSKLSDLSSLPENIKSQTRQISRQAMKIKNLVADLNLASKLEYNMQPLNPEMINLSALLRQITVDFLNSQPGDTYDIDCHLEQIPNAFTFTADASLLYRALENLINNSILHNPNGCHILLSAILDKNILEISVADNGVEASPEKLNQLQNQPHYMMCDSGTGEQRHGLGLVIVKQIVAVHKGELIFEQNPSGGFIARLRFPL